MVDFLGQAVGGLGIPGQQGIPGMNQQGIPGMSDPLRAILTQLGTSPENMPLLQIAKGGNVGNAMLQGLAGGLAQSV